MSTEFSIIISGFKRTAQETLARCMNLMPSSGGSTEILFVDNTRDRKHRTLVERVISENTRPAVSVHYISVPAPGKAAAQNVAVRASSGKFILCLDDDVLPDPALLVAYEQAFLSYPCIAVQGRVELLFEGASPPRWLDSRLRLDLAEMDFGKIIYPFEMGLTGANMAFRREVFSQYGLFDERFGPGRTGTLEDQEYSERIRAAGETQLFWPGASARHRIPPERLRINSFARIHYDVGFSDYLLSRHMVKGGPLKFGLYTLRQCLLHGGAVVLAGAKRQTAQAVYQYCELFKCYGYFRQFLRTRGIKT